jgi:hypothetical protein
MPPTVAACDVLDASHLHGIIAQFQALDITVLTVLSSPEREAPDRCDGSCQKSGPVTLLGSASVLRSG